MKLLINLLYFCIIIFPSYAKAQCDSLYHYVGYEKPMLGTFVEEMPQFPGGDNARIAFLKENIRLPDNWSPESITGKVFITFLVDEEGNIKYPWILRGLNPILDSIAIATISKMPKWVPAKQGGIPVKVLFNLPINFGPDDKLIFIDYNTAIKDIKANGWVSKYLIDLDYAAMLYLDSTCFNVLIKYDKHDSVISKWRKNWDFIQEPSWEQFSQFKVRFKNIKDWFTDNELFREIVQKKSDHVSDWDLENPIYVKDNHRAIFSIFGYHWSETFIANLKDNKLTIIMISSILCD